MSNFVFGLLLTLFSVFSFAKELPQKEFERLNECRRIADLAGKKFWPDIVGFQGPWVYATTDGQFVFNSSLKLQGYELVPLQKPKGDYFSPIKAQWLSRSQVTLDGVDQSAEPVFVFSSISTDPKESDYKNPILYAASFEVVGKTIPFADTEDWMSLFLHEAFHQYQFSSPAVFNQYQKLKKDGVYLDSSQLAQIFEKQMWFKQMLLEENRILLNARNEKDLAKKKALLQKRFESRTKRRDRYNKTTGKSIAETESMWEMIEGGARYFE